MTLSERLISWAQNEEMIDQYYTDHGRDCLEAAGIAHDMEVLHAERDALAAECAAATLAQRDALVAALMTAVTDIEQARDMGLASLVWSEAPGSALASINAALAKAGA